jgi:plastocyanin
MTQRTRFLLLVAAAAAFLASPTAALAQTRLIASVGANDAFVISLTNAAGARVTDIPAGTYEIEVRDLSMHHNFHLQGAGVNQATDVEFVGTVTWTVTFQDRQRYRYVCDPHAGQMNGSFTTGGGPPPSPPPPPPPRVQRLTASVGPGATISLRTASGRRVTRLRAGRYRITVRDRSTRLNFHLIGPRVNRKTTMRFRGTQTWTLTLRRGSYRYVCDPRARTLKGSFRVT